MAALAASDLPGQVPACVLLVVFGRRTRQAKHLAGAIGNQEWILCMTGWGVRGQSSVQTTGVLHSPLQRTLVAFEALPAETCCSLDDQANVGTG